MSLAVLPDHRRSDDRRLLRALERGDPLALVEVQHRTAPAAAACARRLLVAPADIEALLYRVYRRLWDQPPAGAALERWVRACCFREGTRHLRDFGRPPASPSVALLLPDLPAAPFDPSDPAERAIAALDPAARRALLLAHDRGVPSGEQPQRAAAASLRRGLLALADPDDVEEAAAAWGDADLLADWTLGLLPAERAVEVAVRLQASPTALTVVRALRRGRARLEGRAPDTDMVARVLVSVLTWHGAGRPGPEPRPDPGRIFDLDALGRGTQAETAAQTLAGPPGGTAGDLRGAPQAGAPAGARVRRAALTLTAAGAATVAMILGLQTGPAP